MEIEQRSTNTTHNIKKRLDFCLHYRVSRRAQSNQKPYYNWFIIKGRISAWPMLMLMGKDRHDWFPKDKDHLNTRLEHAQCQPI